MSNFPRRVLILGLLLVGLVPAAQAQLSIQITRGVTTPIPIAVVPFAGGDAAAVDVAAVIEADLVRSGRFEALARGDMLTRPTTASQINFKDWRLLRSDFIVIGRMVPQAGGSISVEFELFNVLTGQRLLGMSIPAGPAALRALAHQAADLIYEKIIGVRGAFATRIAYVVVEGRAPERRYRLIVADADGENARPIMESRLPIMSPAWSPDGTRLAYVSFENQASAIFVQTVRSGERRRVSAYAGINGAPSWSPDGARLAVALSQKDGNVDVYVLDLATSALKRVTTDPAIDTEPVWANDGRTLYFTSDRAGRPQIYKVAAEAGDRPQRVTFEGSYNARPRLSPDGTQLAFVTLDQGAFRIAVQDLKTGSSRILTDGRLDESPSYAPNGQTLIYGSRDRSRGVLATVAVDSAVRSRIAAAEGDVREPAWSPFGVSP